MDYYDLYDITPEEEAANDAERVRDIVPVAWRWRWGRIGNTAWHLSLEKPGPFAEEGYEVEPLYTAPASQQVVSSAPWPHGNAPSSILETVEEARTTEPRNSSGQPISCARVWVPVEGEHNDGHYTPECPNVKETNPDDMGGERYRCEVCGYSYYLDYEDMK